MRACDCGVGVCLCVCVSAGLCVVEVRFALCGSVRIMFFIINMWLFFMDRRRLMVVLLFSVDFSVMKLWLRTSGYISGSNANNNTGQHGHNNISIGGWMVMAQDSIMDSGLNKRGKFTVTKNTFIYRPLNRIN